MPEGFVLLTSFIDRRCIIHNILVIFTYAHS